MLRKDLYKKIIEMIISEHASIITNVADINYALELNDLNEAISYLYEGLLNPNLKVIIKLISDIIPTTDVNEILNIDDYTVYKDQHSNIMQKREFMLFESNLIVLNCNKLILHNDIEKEKIIKSLEYICTEESYRREFLSYVATATSFNNDYYLIYKSSDFSQMSSAWQLYSYALFKYTCNNKIGINSDLVYDTSEYSILSENTFDYRVKYEQYFDIYDVLSELHHAKDILTAFLKMYQVLEYITYRKELVTIVKNSTLKQSFVRQVKGLDSKYGKNERETFKNIFLIIGSIATNFTGADITTDIKDFCKTYYPVNGNGNCYLEDISDVSLAKFIYDTRCSIVHNKESEFHMTYSNCDEYISLIPFMKKIIEIVRDKIASVINDDNSLIKFLSPQLNLY